jgi:AcrR family transcriptional regulator
MNQLTAKTPLGAAAETKGKILDASEALFGEHGFAATSLRMITSHAGVNLAAVNYHFQSKEALMQAVFTRRIEPINRGRIEMLDRCEAAAGEGPLPLEGVIRAFVEPMIRAQQDAPAADFRRLLGRMYVEPGESVRRFLRDQLRDVVRRFTAAFRRALPGLPPSELLWRMHFGIGVMVHVLAGAYHLEIVSGGLCDPSDADAMISRIVTFLAAGLRAPVSSFSVRG